MDKLKTLLILLLAAALIAAGAFLPGMAAALRDGDTIGQARFEQVRPVRLTIREPLPASAKLALMNQIDGVIELSDGKASMTRGEVEEAAYAALESYIDAGLMEPFETFFVEIRCLLGSAPENPELNGIFWTVLIEGAPNADYFCVDLVIDDDTGRLLGINCIREYPVQETNREKMLSDFAAVYFTGLDILDYGYFATDDLAGYYIGDNACAIRYRFGDIIYGEINVDLHVYEHGFYTEFPDLYEGESYVNN